MENIAETLGINGDDRWDKRAACAGQPVELFFRERGSGHTGVELTIQDMRAKRICARCPVRRQCLTETIKAEGPQHQVARNAARGGGSWAATPETMATERHLPAGIFAGTTPAERWSPDVIHADGCGGKCKCSPVRGHATVHENWCRGTCRGCRPIADRIAILERRLESQSSQFLLKSETIAPLG